MACEELTVFKMTCDRCERTETVERANGGQDKPSKWMTIDLRLNGGDSIGPSSYSPERDLCPACAEALGRFISNGVLR
jgi:hypothetical protein